MKIALICPGFSIDEDDWAIPVLQTLAVSLAQDHEVHVFSLRYPKKGLYKFSALTHHATGGGNRAGVRTLPVVINTLRAIESQHRINSFDIIHAFWADEAGLVGVRASNKIKRPVLVSLGGGELVYLPDIDYGTQASLIRRQIIRYALKRATAISAGSGYQVKLVFDNEVSPGKVHQVPLGVNTSLFKPGPSPDLSQPTLIQAASLTPVKNQLFLLQVLRLVKDKIPNIQLILAGSGPMEGQIKELAGKLKLADNLKLLPEQPHAAMPAVYQLAHLYLQTSWHESQGMSVLEAMACGLPALGTPTGILPEVSPLPATNDGGLLAGQIVKIFSNLENYENVRRQIRRLVEEEYSLQVSKSRFLNLYDRLLKNE